MKYFFYKLIPPRPDFAFTLTPAETAMMQEHSRYWDRVIAAGGAVTLGPVGDPAGVYGIGVIQAETLEIAQGLVRADPALQAETGCTSELHPMLGIKLRPGS